MRFLILLVFYSFFPGGLTAQSWLEVGLPGAKLPQNTTTGRYFRARAAELENRLWSVPYEKAALPPVRLTLPLADGMLADFHLFAYHLMPEEDQRYFPGIRTFYGVNPDRPQQTVYLDWTTNGLHAVIHESGQPAMYLDPYEPGKQQLYKVYYKKNQATRKSAFRCLVPGQIKKPRASSRKKSFPTCSLREYTIAVSATPQYSNYHGATSDTAANRVQSAIITTLNRVNAIYARDLGLRFRLVSRNDRLYFYTPADSPFSTNEVLTLINENTDVIDARLGSGTYDIGHVFTQGQNNGVGRLQSACGDAWPGAGATSLENPAGDPFAVDYVAHEIGHQLGANHTQNNLCNYNSATGMEPGSGSTVMSYAGICPPNVQSNSDPYFHAVSMAEITNFLNSPGLGDRCGIILERTLDVPVVSGDSSHIVPAGTPLRLAASSKGNGRLLHTWEQYDPEQAPMPPESSSTVGPLFRSFSPSADTFRYLPSLPAVMGGFDPLWEELPLTDRRLNFRFTARNTTEQYGCHAGLDLRLDVRAEAGPFVLTDPVAESQWSAGQIAQVRWDVAGTDALPFRTPTVAILLTTDSGNNFITLADSLPNNGQAEVVVPEMTTDNAQILVRSEDNIFFNVSRPFRIVATTGRPDVQLVALSPTSQTDCFTQNNKADFSVVTQSRNGASALLALTLEGFPEQVESAFSQGAIRPGGQFSLQLTGLDSLPRGTYQGSIRASSTEDTSQLDIQLVKLGQTVARGPDLQAPVGRISSVRPVLQVAGDATSNYQFQLSATEDFRALRYDTTTTDPNFVVPDYLAPLTRYYWRVRSQRTDSRCETSGWSEATFHTGDCFSVTSPDPPQVISNGHPPQVTTLTVDVPAEGVLIDLDVAQLDITHSYIRDLQIDLSSPSGTRATLLNRECGAENNLFLNLDDEGRTRRLPCPPILPKGFIPPLEDPLSLFDGASPAGRWTLTVTDLASQDGGSLNSFSLRGCLEMPPLPVFTGFTAESRPRDVLLRWAVSPDVNTFGLFVERSLHPDSDNWEALAYIANGASDSFVDAAVVPGFTYYYRLRHLQPDERITLSTIRSAQRRSQPTGRPDIFPNPSHGEIQYPASPGLHQPQPYRLLDARGRLLQRGLWQPSGGTISLRDYPAGVYQLRLEDGRILRVVRL